MKRGRGLDRTPKSQQTKSYGFDSQVASEPLQEIQMRQRDIVCCCGCTDSGQEPEKKPLPSRLPWTALGPTHRSAKSSDSEGSYSFSPTTKSTPGWSPNSHVRAMVVWRYIAYL